jgi:hypothetical protein
MSGSSTNSWTNHASFAVIARAAAICATPICAMRRRLSRLLSAGRPVQATLRGPRCGDTILDVTDALALLM